MHRSIWDHYDEDKAMAQELRETAAELGIDLDTIEPPTAEEIAEEQERAWYFSFEEGMQRAWTAACVYLASHCPTCGRELGEPDFEPDDPSVGIFGVAWINECPEHGLFLVDELGKYEWEVQL